MAKSGYLLYRREDFNDRNFCIKAVNINGTHLKNVPYKDDPEIVELAIKNNPASFIYAGKSIIENKRLVSEFISKYGVNLHCGMKLCDDREIAILAVSKDPKNISFLSDRLRDDKELAIMALSRNNFFYHCLSPRLKADKDIMMLCKNNFRKK